MSELEERQADMILKLKEKLQDAEGRVADLERYWSRSAQSCAEWQTEVERLKKEKLAIVRGEFGQICSYCGEGNKDGLSWEELQAHIKSCSKHPLFKAEADANKMARELAVVIKRNQQYLNALKTVKANSLNPAHTMTMWGLESVTDANFRIAEQALKEVCDDL